MKINITNADIKLAVKKLSFTEKHWLPKNLCKIFISIVSKSSFYFLYMKFMTSEGIYYH